MWLKVSTLDSSSTSERTGPSLCPVFFATFPFLLGKTRLAWNWRRGREGKEIWSWSSRQRDRWIHHFRNVPPSESPAPQQGDHNQRHVRSPTMNSCCMLSGIDGRTRMHRLGMLLLPFILFLVYPLPKSSVHREWEPKFWWDALGREFEPRAGTISQFYNSSPQVFTYGANSNIWCPCLSCL